MVAEETVAETFAEETVVAFAAAVIAYVDGPNVQVKVLPLIGVVMETPVFVKGPVPFSGTLSGL